MTVEGMAVLLPRRNVERGAQLHDFDRPPDWEAVRMTVEAGEMTRVGICRKFRISRAELARRIKANKWDVPERDDALDRSLLLDGLFWALERQIEQAGKAELTDAGKEAAVLQRLAGTLDDLIRLGDKNAGSAPRSARQTKEMVELRQKIARRIDELNLQ
jgi:hypothetical protein